MYDAWSVDSNMKRSWFDDMTEPFPTKRSCPRSSAMGL